MQNDLKEMNLDLGDVLARVTYQRMTSTHFVL